MTPRDHCIALRQARIAYWMARRRLSRLNGEGKASAPKRGAALRDVTAARRNLERQAHYTHGWLAGRKDLRQESLARASYRAALSVRGTVWNRPNARRLAAEIEAFVRGGNHGAV